MAKDAQGHGSDGRGGASEKDKDAAVVKNIRDWFGITPDTPKGGPGYAAHQQALADQHGISTSHLSPLNVWIKAEQAGKDAFRDGSISSHKAAERFARKAYAAVLERETFVAGWNRGFWDEQDRVLKASRSNVVGGIR